jgi:hypothetical protein
MSADVFAEDRESSALQLAATPEVYQSNAFRILGLTVTATAAEVNKKKERLKKSLKFGADSDDKSLFSRVPRPSLEDIDRAAHYILGEPPNWLIDELFWFFVSEGDGEDKGVRMLRESNVKGALDYWATLPRDTELAAIAVHNAAVLNHLLALDLELVLDNEQRSSWQRQLDNYWSESYLNWWRVTNDDLLWDWLSKRVRQLVEQLGDRRLTTGAVRRVRLALPAAIVAIGAKVAVRAATAKDVDLAEVERHVSYLSYSNFDPGMIASVLEREAIPLKERVRSLCQAMPAASKAAPDHANQLAHRLLADTCKILQAISALLGDGHQISESACNSVARVVRDCLIDFGNATDDWQECCGLLEQARALARDTALREKIERDLRQANENLRWKRAEPAVEEIKTLCESVAERSKANPSRANQLARRLLTDTEKILEAVAAFLGEDHPVVLSACNNVADVVRDCLIDFGNATQNWEECCVLLEQLRSIAKDGALREQIEKDLSQAKENCRWKEREAQINRLSQEAKKGVASNRVYDVALRGTSAIVPNACTCCLGVPDLHQRVSQSWEETRGSRRYKRTFSFDFPLCRECLGHQRQYNRKRLGLVSVVVCVSAVLMSVMLSSVAWYASGPDASGVNRLPLAQQANTIGKIHITTALLVGAFVTTALLLLLGRFFRVRELSDEHASRERPIRLLSAGDMHMKVRFYHPLYANRFAESNNVRAVEAKTTKAPRGVGIVKKATLVSTLLPSMLIAGVGHAIGFAVIEEVARQHVVANAGSRSVSSRNTSSIDPNRSGSQVTPSANRNPQRLDSSSKKREPTQMESSRPASAPIVASTGLKEKIESGKARARRLENQLNQMQSQMDSLKAQIDQYKGEIDQYERRMRQGIDVNEYLYKDALRSHNALVSEYNNMLAKYRSVRAEYDDEIDSVNEMVGRYNAGER